MSPVGRFTRPSLSIELDGDHFPFDDNYLYGPAAYDEPLLRVYVHEVLHFWQTLSQGFLAALALGEWQQLLEFERTGSAEPQEELQAALSLFYEPDPVLGFSTWNLYEALCRFWDVHILGPRKLFPVHPELDMYPPDSPPLVRYVDGLPQYSSLAFDLLMGVEDHYAAPYRVGLERWGSPASVILFPLVGYFALQSPIPVLVFADAVDQLAGALELDKEPSFVIHDVWPQVFEVVAATCAESCQRVCQGAHLVTGRSIIAQSPLADHPVYAHYLALLNAAAETWKPTIPSGLEYCFALPGDPNSRQRLANAFRPPVTRFYDGYWTGETMLSFSARVLGGVAEVQTDTDLAEMADDIDRRFRAMREAGLVARYARQRSASS